MLFQVGIMCLQKGYKKKKKKKRLALIHIISCNLGKGIFFMVKMYIFSLKSFKLSVDDYFLQKSNLNKIFTYRTCRTFE
jgi:uncharacterized membrane protein